MTIQKMLGRVALCAALTGLSGGALRGAEPDEKPAPAGERPAADAPRRAPGEGDRPQFDPARMIERLKNQVKDFDLTSEQQTRVDELMKATEARLTELGKENEGKEGPDQFEGIRPIIAEHREKLAEILTEEQRAKLERQDRAGREAGRGPGGGGFGFGPGGGNMFARMGEFLKERLGELDLTEDQKAKSDALIEENAKTMQEMADKMRAQGEEFQAKMKEILTPEQQEKFEELMQPRFGPGGGRPGRGPGGGDGGGRPDNAPDPL